MFIFHRKRVRSFLEVIWTFLILEVWIPFDRDSNFLCIFLRRVEELRYILENPQKKNYLSKLIIVNIHSPVTGICIAIFHEISVPTNLALSESFCICNVYFSKFSTQISLACNCSLCSAYCPGPGWGSSNKFMKYNPPKYSQVQTHNICSKLGLQTTNAGILPAENIVTRKYTKYRK